MARKKNKLIKNIVKYSAIVAALIILLFPVYWMFVSSLRTVDNLMSLPPKLFPRDATLSNYLKIFTNIKYLTYFKNSFIVSFGTVLIVLIVAVPAGYALSRFRFKAKNPILTAVSSVQMFPQVVLLVGLYSFFSKWGLLDT
jgi:ABC-type glycerol-3-phosphate transport system permease component